MARRTSWLAVVVAVAMAVLVMVWVLAMIHSFAPDAADDNDATVAAGSNVASGPGTEGRQRQRGKRRVDESAASDGAPVDVFDFAVFNATLEALRTEVRALQTGLAGAEARAADDRAKATSALRTRIARLERALNETRGKLRDTTASERHTAALLARCQEQVAKLRKDTTAPVSNAQPERQPERQLQQQQVQGWQQDAQHASQPDKLSEVDAGYVNEEELIRQQQKQAVADGAYDGLPDDPTDAPEPPSEGIRDPGLIHDTEYTIPVVVFTYGRPEMLRKCLDHLTPRLPRTGFRLFLSQDSRKFPEITDILNSYVRDHPRTVHLIHRRNDSGANAYERANHWQPYFAIAHHYKFALEQVFSVPHYDRVILLEEDLEVSPDFFSYMRATAPLFDQDPSLYCVSGWNDNGKKPLVADTEQLYRTDFFPGLGWMLSRAVWKSLERRWPNGFWDDWMRQPDKRSGRSCIRPEVPRSFTWCSDDGVSQGQFCAEHIEDMKLADTVVDWNRKNMSRLLKSNYDPWLANLVAKATETTFEELPLVSPGVEEVRILYRTPAEFVILAKRFELMDDFKEHVPRTAYRGIVSFRHRGHRVHLVPRAPLY